jgi:arylsulfatase A-like enzyme
VGFHRKARTLVSELGTIPRVGPRGGGACCRDSARCGACAGAREAERDCRGAGHRATDPEALRGRRGHGLVGDELSGAVYTSHLEVRQIRAVSKGPAETVLAALVAVTAAGLAGCRAGGSSHANLLLVTIDTLRADHTSAYGYARETTPHLEALASEGLLVETAYAPIPVTGPSHASLLTALYPRAHGVVRNGYVLDDAHATVAERLRERGYATAAIVSAFPLDPRFGLDRGFEHYDASFTREEASLPDPRWEGEPLGQPYDRRGDATTERALRWLKDRPVDRPFFLWTHYFDPHTPYAPPVLQNRWPSGGDAGPADRYDGEIHFADAQIGRLLAALEDEGIGSRTLVVVTADHGEGLGEHGCDEHGPNVYEEAVRIPLILRWPGRLAPGRRLPGPAGLADVAPTVLDLIGLTPLEGAQGRSLVPALDGRAPDGDEREVLLQAEYPGRPGLNVFGARLGRYKYVESREGGAIARQELYDLERDPSELVDLSSQEPDQTVRLARVVARWRKRIRAPESQRAGPESEEALRALGYVQ